MCLKGSPARLHLVAKFLARLRAEKRCREMMLRDQAARRAPLRATFEGDTARTGRPHGSASLTSWTMSLRPPAPTATIMPRARYLSRRTEKAGPMASSRRRRWRCWRRFFGASTTPRTGFASCPMRRSPKPPIALAQPSPRASRRWRTRGPLMGPADQAGAGSRATFWAAVRGAGGCRGPRPLAILTNAGFRVLSQPPATRRAYCRPAGMVLKCA
jgi:hypothetical protein